MATNKLQWKRIAKGDKLPCQSFLRKKNGEILKLSTVGGVTVGQDAYYLPVDEVIEEIRNYPIEESEDEKIKKAVIDAVETLSDSPLKVKMLAWVKKQGEQKHQYNSRPRYVGEEELLGTNKQGKCPFLKQELIDMGFVFTQDGDLAYPIHKIENKEFAAWSEEDERIKNNLLSELTNLSVRKLIKKETEKKYASWLKNIKDRVQPQPKQEWSEEDKEVWAMVISLVERQDNISPTIPLHEDRIKMLDWLKSLRPQSLWKPSEEMLKALYRTIPKNVMEISEDEMLLDKLYQGLKYGRVLSKN